VAFAWINIMPVANLRLLAEHGADLNAVNQFGAPLVVSAAEAENWEAVIFLIEKGADVRRPDSGGRTLSDLIDDRLNGYTKYGAEAPQGLLRVKALLNPGQHS
jgi:uncharacterized protein